LVVFPTAVLCVAGEGVPLDPSGVSETVVVGPDVPFRPAGATVMLIAAGADVPLDAALELGVAIITAAGEDVETAAEGPLLRAGADVALTTAVGEDVVSCSSLDCEDNRR
jgi:hypothetical protein